MPIRTITTTDEQDALFDACDAGVPILMERKGVQYLVVRNDRLDALAAMVHMHEAKRKIVEGSMTDLLPGLIAANR